MQQIRYTSRTYVADSLLANRRFPEALIAYTRLLGCLDSSGPPDSLSARFHRDYGWALARGDSTEEAGKYPLAP